MLKRIFLFIVLLLKPCVHHSTNIITLFSLRRLIVHCTLMNVTVKDLCLCLAFSFFFFLHYPILFLFFLFFIMARIPVLVTRRGLSTHQTDPSLSRAHL